MSWSYAKRMEAKTYTAFVFARGGSKGIPGKNIQLAGGKPLLAHSIECGLASRYIDKVIVSTDSEAIAKVAREYGGQVLERSPELAQDATPELEAWRHAVRSTEEELRGRELFISLPATAPLRAPMDVDAAIEHYFAHECDIVFGISPSHRNPYLNMVRIDSEGHIKVVMDDATSVRRQDVPECYDITTCVYVAGLDYVMQCTRPIDGRVGYVTIPPERALDIDSEFDLYLADLILSHPFKAKEE